MATIQKERLRPLTLAEQRELKTITKASSERVDRVQRATALLAVAGGQSFSGAARAAGYRSPGAVTYLVRRFNRVGLGALKIAAGRGRRPTYDALARARIVATAQRAPDRKLDGTATWSLSTLERSIRRRKKKGGHRPGVPASRGGRRARLVPGRGRSVPGDSAAWGNLGARGQ